ncbi:MAG: hemerythrin family protein [Methylobacteriaceae bacterium]|nr:hemerythrin family protein [Methylobacteriaceae bacterium]
MTPMPARAPQLPLGVAEMDEDHARLEAMMEAAALVVESDLAAALAAVQRELAAHFVREETLLAEAGFPALGCHVAQHRRLLELAAEAMATSAARPAELRGFLADVLPGLVAGHIASIDRVSAEFLNGRISGAMFGSLRAAGQGAAS